MKAVFFKPGDIIECPNHTGGTDLYHIAGIYMGAPGYDSVVELVSICKMPTPGAATTARVPMRMLEAGVCAGAFTHEEIND
jgi:hypothetical protein